MRLPPICLGCHAVPVRFLQRIRELCDQHGIVMIADEVQCGCGRTGRLFAVEHYGIVPDLIVSAKSLGAGMPIGAVTGRAEIMDLLAPLGPVYQAGTLSGNPLALAAGIAALRLLDETNPYAALHRSGAQIRTAVLAAAAAKGLPVQVPQFGSMFSIFFNPSPVTDLASATSSDSKLYGRFFHACLARGVYLAPSAYEAAFLSTAHDAAVVDRACEILSAALAEL